jgi:hypothetical protein
MTAREHQLRYVGESVNAIIDFVIGIVRKGVEAGAIEDRVAAGWAIQTLLSSASTIAGRLGIPKEAMAKVYRDAAEAELSGMATKHGEMISSLPRPS